MSQSISLIKLRIFREYPETKSHGLDVCADMKYLFSIFPFFSFASNALQSQLIHLSPLNANGYLSKNVQALQYYINRLSKRFIVSTLVVIARCKRLNLISAEKSSELWSETMNKIQIRKRRQSSGGDFFTTLKYRVGINFAKSVIAEIASNNLSYQDAFRLLQVKNTESLVKLSQIVGLPIL